MAPTNISFSAVNLNFLGVPSRNVPTTSQTNKKKMKNNPVGSQLITETHNLRDAVKLPPGEDINEWLAINIVDFYNQVNVLYATLGEFCTPTTCPIMNAGPKYEYKWGEGIFMRKPLVVSAPEHVEYLMNWIEALIDNKTIFPQKLGEPFPPNFGDVVKRMFKRLFRVYAHIYHSHFNNVVSLEEQDHLNTCFSHFVFFVSEFKLIDEEQLDPLKELVEEILNL